MARSHRRKEESGNSNGALQDNRLEGSSARTRPFSYDEIMLRRKNREDAANQDANGPGMQLASDNIERSAHSPNSKNQLNEGSTMPDARHTAEDSLEARSGRKRDANASSKNEILVQDRDKGSRAAVIKLKSTVEKNVSSNRVTGGEDENRHHAHHRSRKKDGLLGDDFHNGSNKRQDRDSVKKSKDSEKIRGESRKDKKQLHNEDKHVHRKRKTDEHVGSDLENEPKRRNARDGIRSDRSAKRSRDKHEKESTEKGHRHEEERNKGGSSVRRNDSKKKGLDTTVYLEESKSKKKRSRSREREKEKSGRRSLSHSPKAHRHTFKDKKEHGESPHKHMKDRSGREHLDVDNKRVSSNGSSSHYRRGTGSSSGLGGYSPRKRKTDAAAKTPSPTHRSPEKRTAGWDLPPVGKETIITGSTPSNLTLSNQNLLLSAKEIPTSTPVTPTIVKPVKLPPYALSSQMHAVESIQLTQATRPMRTLYVENLPATVSQKDLMECINSYLLSSGVNHIQVTQPCISCVMHKEKGQALLEFLTPEYASMAISLNGISFAGSELKLRRPKDYTETGLPDKSVVVADSISAIVEDSPHKIFIGGVSKSISAEMLLEIAKVFGSVKAFHFDHIAGINGPCAFIEYVDHSDSSKACAGLNGMLLGGQVLTSVFATPDSTLVDNVGKPPFYRIPEHAKPLLEKPTAVLKLKNVVDPVRLLSLSELELEEILEDIRLECSRFGTVKSINLAKPTNLSGSTEAYEAKDPNGCNLKLGNESNVSERLNDIINEQGQPDESQPPGVLDEHENKIESVEEDKVGNDSGGSSMKSNRSPNLSDQTVDNNITEGEVREPSPIVLSTEKVDIHEGEIATQQNASLNELASSDGHSGCHPVGNAETETTSLVEEQFKLEGKITESVENKEVVDVPEDEKKDVSADCTDVFEQGCVFVEYRRPEAACMAAHSLHGRTFDGRVVFVGYMEYELYQMRFRK